MKKILKCNNDECEWVGESKELKPIIKNRNGDWGCPKCNQPFFRDANCTKDVTESKCKDCGQKLDDYEKNCDYCLPCFDTNHKDDEVKG